MEKVGRIKEAKETRNKHCPSLRLKFDNVGEFLYSSIFAYIGISLKALCSVLGSSSSKKCRTQFGYQIDTVDFSYDMNSLSSVPSGTHPHGIALIINTDKYDDPQLNRQGSDKDRDALRETLVKLGYQVEVEENLKGGRVIIDKVFEYASKNESCDSFICCILAHGHENGVMGSDGRSTKIKDISMKLTEVVHLQEKPKVFFIQAYQSHSMPRLMRLGSTGVVYQHFRVIHETVIFSGGTLQLTRLLVCKVKPLAHYTYRTSVQSWMSTTPRKTWLLW